MKYKICKVALPNLGCRAFVIIAKDLSFATKKVFQKAPLGEDIRNARAVTCSRGNCSYVFLKPDADAGEVAHEMWHVIRHLFGHIGAELENEIVAYNLEYLVVQGMDILKKYARKIK